MMSQRITSRRRNVSFISPRNEEFDVGLDIDGTPSRSSSSSNSNNYGDSDSNSNNSKGLRHAFSVARLFATARSCISNTTSAAAAAASASASGDNIRNQTQSRKNRTAKVFFLSILILNIVQLYDSMIISEGGTSLNGLSYHRRIVDQTQTDAALYSSGPYGASSLASLRGREQSFDMKSMPFSKQRSVIAATNNSGEAIDVSIIVLTSQNHEELRGLLPSVLHQSHLGRQPLWTSNISYNFEIIVVDNLCLPETKKTYFDIFIRNDGKTRTSNVPHQYLPLCAKDGNSYGYGAGNNRAVDVASKNSKYLLFLGDYIQRLNDANFIMNMVHLLETKANAGGVVCKVLNKKGKVVVDAGNVLWSDASAIGVTGRQGVGADDHSISYARPIDYGPGSCLMMKKDIVEGYRGFEHANFDNYFEDADLQSYVQHGLGKEIWFQPYAVALRGKSKAKAENVTRNNKRTAETNLKKRWKNELQTKHLISPYGISDTHEKALHYMRAKDLRARDASKANILWLEQAVPNPDNCSDFGRAYDNLSIVADLGHRITLVTLQALTDSKSWCDELCQHRISDLGVEVIATGTWSEYLAEYIDFYDIVYVRRPSTFETVYGQLQKLYEKHQFSLIYDSEGLRYKRDQLLLSLIEHRRDQLLVQSQANTTPAEEGEEGDAEGLNKNTNYPRFPGGIAHFALSTKEGGIDIDSTKLDIKHAKEAEQQFIQMADTVIAVSEKEKQAVLKLLPDTHVVVAGHTMTIDRDTVASTEFNKRSGILFLGSFNDDMFYNGDAVWYFLNEVFPLVLMASKTSPYPVQLTIAGTDIPKSLKHFVETDDLLMRNVIFREVADAVAVQGLYKKARIFIAPHQYGAGIQYEVSKAFSFGVPVVMTPFTANSFGIKAEDKIGCVGADAKSMKECIMGVNLSSSIWNELRQNELEFIEKTHNRNDLVTAWDRAIEINLHKVKDIRASDDKEKEMRKMKHGLLTTKITEALGPCPEGERFYALKHPHVEDAVKRGIYASHFAHFVERGRNEGKKYHCDEDEIEDAKNSSSSVSVDEENSISSM